MKTLLAVGILLAGVASQRPPNASGGVAATTSDEETNTQFTPAHSPSDPVVGGVLIVLPHRRRPPPPPLLEDDEEEEEEEKEETAVEPSEKKGKKPKSKTKKHRKLRKLGKHKNKKKPKHRKQKQKQRHKHKHKHKQMKKLDRLHINKSDKKLLRKHRKQGKLRKQLEEAEERLLFEKAEMDMTPSQPNMTVPEMLIEADPVDERVARVVYRGDERPPWVLRALGGIPTEFVGSVVNASFSLEAHHLVDGRWRNFRSAYTTTARRFGSAAIWAADPRLSDGWVYMIHATPNMINVTDSGFPLTYKAETEFAAMGGIRWDQIMGWTHVPMYDRPVIDPRDMCALFLQNAFLPKAWIANGEYNHRYDGFYSSGGQPQLRFEQTEDVVHHDDDHGERRLSLEQHAREFMRHNGEAVGWNEDSFPFLNLRPPNGVAAFVYRSWERLLEVAIVSAVLPPQLLYDT
ncbi:putative heat-labile enterotoxi [Ophiocordyceps camponoti-leonardi (nom. inval.)]|nr:putative heat-labile enterotoxi [Ophiocordyceps camponoti-leonardi (nom. inval.)]